MSITPETGGPPRENQDFCQKPSDRYMALLDECDDDPRSVAGHQALRDLRRTGGWAPTIDARDARVVVKEGK